MITTCKKRVLLVDDHPVVIDGLRQLIGQAQGLTVVESSPTAHDALDALDTHEVDLAIVDISLNGINGIDLIKHIKTRHEGIRVLVLTMHREVLYAERSLRAGADGFVTKRESPATILKAIQTVLSGGLFVSDEVGSRMLNRFVRHSDEKATPVSRLSDRELEVLCHLGDGRGTRDTARRMNLSVKTIESHRANIKRKLDLRNSTELIRFAVKWQSRSSNE